MTFANDSALLSVSAVFSSVLVAFVLGVLAACYMNMRGWISSAFSSAATGARRVSAAAKTGEPVKMTLVVRKDLKMGTGKTAAQCAHAAVAAVEDVLAARSEQPGHPWGQWYDAWHLSGSAKVAVQVQTEDELVEVAAKARSLNLPCYLVRDAGRTQIAAGSKTVVAVGPGPVSLVDQKLILAEALDLLRQCEVREYEVDKMKSSVSHSSKPDAIVRLFQNYDSVFREYTRGLQMLNHVRRTAIEDPNPQNAGYNKKLSDFCAGKIQAYLDRAANVNNKKDSILIPLNYVESIGKPGCIPDDTIYALNGQQYPLGGKEKVVNQVHPVSDGTYSVTIKNCDSYSVAAPDVTATITLTPQNGGDPLRLERKVAGQTGFRRFLGVVGPGSLQLQVRASGMRDAHVDIVVQKWRMEGDFKDLGAPSFGGDFAFVETSKPAQGSAGAATNFQQQQQPQAQQGAGGLAPLPPIPDDELAQLANFNVPSASLTSGGRQQPPGMPPPQQQQQQQGSAGDAWAALEHMAVPHVGAGGRPNETVVEPVVVNPQDLNCQERLARIRRVLDAWPQNNVMATNLGTEEQRFLQGVNALPFPTEIA